MRRLVSDAVFAHGVFKHHGQTKCVRRAVSFALFACVNRRRFS